MKAERRSEFWHGTLTLKPCKEKLMFDMHTAIQAKSIEQESPAWLRRQSTPKVCLSIYKEKKSTGICGVLLLRPGLHAQ